MRKTREQELISREFSHLMIEGLETERKRISRELHDTIIPQVHEKILSEQIRAICIELMPPDFSCLSLKDALTQFCVQFSNRTGIVCVCFIEENLNFRR